MPEVSSPVSASDQLELKGEGTPSCLLSFTLREQDVEFELHPRHAVASEGHATSMSPFAYAIQCRPDALTRPLHVFFCFAPCGGGWIKKRVVRARINFSRFPISHLVFKRASVRG